MESIDLNQLIIDWIGGSRYVFPHENMQFVRGAGNSQIGPDGITYEYLIIINRDTRIYMSDVALLDAINYGNVEDLRYNNDKLNDLVIEIRKINTENKIGNYKLIVDSDSFHFSKINKSSK